MSIVLELQRIRFAKIQRTDLAISSFGLYRPLLGLAIHHLVCLSTALPHSPIISLPHVQTVLRSVYEAIATAQPLDIPPAAGLGYSGRPTSAVGGHRARFSLSEASGVAVPVGGMGLSTGPAAVGGGGGPLPGSTVVAGNLLVEMVESGQVGLVGKREFLGVEPSRDLWRRILG